MARWRASSYRIPARTTRRPRPCRNGWKDVFLDLDPKRGLVAGERWQDALKTAAHRCEAVLVLISEAWLASKWCLAEVNTARLLGKRILPVLIEPIQFKLSA